MNIFAIGDIHGCSKQLISLQDKIFNYPTYNKESDLIIYLGDYIDRGPNSKDVIQHILKLQKEKVNSIFLMGNHEQIMIDFVFNKINNLRYWLNLGADQTFKKCICSLDSSFNKTFLNLSILSSSNPSLMNSAISIL